MTAASKYQPELLLFQAMFNKELAVWFALLTSPPATHSQDTAFTVNTHKNGPGLLRFTMMCDGGSVLLPDLLTLPFTQVLVRRFSQSCCSDELI